MAQFSGTQFIPLTFGFGVIGAFLWLSYRHKLETYNEAGVTTEVSGLVTYVIGALVSRESCGLPPPSPSSACFYWS